MALRILDSYREAKAHCDRLRSQPPRVYNEERLYEMPIPIIPNGHENNETAVSSTNENDSDVNTSANDQTDLHELTHSILDENSRCNEFDSLNISKISDSNVTSTIEEDDVLLPTTGVFLEANENSDTDITPDPALIDPIKDEPELDLSSEEQNHLEDILNDVIDANLSSIVPSNEAESESDDEPELIDKDKLTEFPKPMAANLLGLTKHEEDTISMCLAFNEKVIMFSNSKYYFLNIAKS